MVCFASIFDGSQIIRVFFRAHCHLRMYCETKTETRTILFKLIGDQSRKNVPCSLRILFAADTVKNMFLFVLYLFEPSALDVLDQRWLGGTWAGSMLRCMLDSDWTWWEIQWPCAFAFLNSCNTWLVVISSTPRSRPGQSL